MRFDYIEDFEKTKEYQDSVFALEELGFCPTEDNYYFPYSGSYVYKKIIDKNTTLYPSLISKLRKKTIDDIDKLTLVVYPRLGLRNSGFGVRLENFNNITGNNSYLCVESFDTKSLQMLLDFSINIFNLELFFTRYAYSVIMRSACVNKDNYVYDISNEKNTAVWFRSYQLINSEKFYITYNKDIYTVDMNNLDLFFSGENK